MHRRYKGGQYFRKINRGQLEQLPVPVAPAPEQARIVAVIEEQFSRLDVGSAAVHNARSNAKRMLTAVLDSAVAGRLVPRSGKLSDATQLVKYLSDEAAAIGKAGKSAPAAEYLSHVPGSWEVVALSDLAQSIDYGTSEKTSSDAKGVPVLRMGNLGRGTISFDDLKYLPRAKIDEKMLLQRGDLLFNRTNSAELVGKTAVFRGYHEEAAFASYLIRIRPLPSASMYWASIVLNSTIGRRYVAGVRSQQVGQANVNGTKLAATPIPLPPAGASFRQA